MRSALRKATGPVHERIHQAPQFAAMESKQLDMSGYTDLLQRIAAFHFTVGPDLDLDDGRVERLSRDLEVLGSRRPSPIRWTIPETSAAKLGWTYVVEGSCLGGRVLYRRLDYLFGDSPNGRCFFKGSAADQVRWRTLCSRLEQEGASEGALDRMIEGANDAFALFEQLFAPVHAHG